MTIQIPKTANDGLTKYLGDKADVFLQKAKVRLENHTKLWQLSRLSFMPTNTVNLLFECESAIYGQCVLKLCIPGPEVATEVNCIRAYDSNGYVKLWDYSLTDDILLLERVTPGAEMWAVTDYKERARLMAQRIKGLSFVNFQQGEYPTYHAWLTGVHKKLTCMNDMDDVIFYLNKALDIYSALKQTYKRSCLLHGDMHQENMLLNSQGNYTIIDPKGVIDDPVMETARFLMNEVPCDGEKIHEMVSIMAPIIGIPESDILKSMYIDAALGSCWTLEEHFPSKAAFDKNKQEALETCKFVYGLLENK
ncbi:MAG: hypothetical protein FWC77_07030 [Defluviitaleaceae bacterium]|nr:hypothetical protein [Defluviitaleaceae bacterium]